MLAAALVLAVSPTAWASSHVPLSFAPGIREMGVLILEPRLAESDRLDLMRSLGNWSGEEVVGPLVQALKDPSPAIREGAAAALGASGQRGAVPALRERLEDRAENPLVRGAAARALGQIGDMAARDAVLAATRDGERDVRLWALWSLTLGGLQKPEDRVSLLMQLAGDPALDLATRVEAIQALGEANATQAAPVMAKLLGGEATVPMPLPAPNATQQDIMGVR